MIIDTSSRVATLGSHTVGELVVAVVGGGQLARMMAGPATALGVQLRVLVESATAAAAAPAHLPQVGAATDIAAVVDLVAGANVLTFEHEHIPGAVLQAAIDAGVPVHPTVSALAHAQDKQLMRQHLTELGLPCPRWAPIGNAAELEHFLAQHAGEAVVKTTRGGYDGKGVRVITQVDQVADWLQAYADGTGAALIAEEKVPFRRELAVLVARNPSGQIVTWPVVESVQQGGVCEQVIAPAPSLDEATAAAAQQTARAVAAGLNVTGVLAVEMFEVDTPDGPTVLINELAMRPHNSGHWTIDGSVTSQFEQHLRAVLDLPLGATTMLAPWSVMVNVLGSTRADLTAGLAQVLADDQVKVHLYGKEVRPGRKLGHVTVSGSHLADVRSRALRAAAVLRGEE